MSLQSITHERGKYLAFVLSEASRAKLLSVAPPKFQRVLCHHVTIAFRLSAVDLDRIKKALGPADPEVLVTGLVSTDELECFTVRVGSSEKRDDGGFYHVTHSLDQGVKPVHSNEILKRKHGKPDIPYQKSIRLTGKFELC